MVTNGCTPHCDIRTKKPRGRSKKCSGGGERSGALHRVKGRKEPYDETADLREAWQARIDEFDGAKLTVTVTFTDGTTDTQTLTLHTGKLAVTYPDDISDPRLTGEVLTDEQAAEQGYVYGVYAEIA